MKIKRYIVFLIGIILIALGVNLLNIAHLGLAPWDAINFALGKQFNVSTGMCINVISMILLCIMAIWLKKRIKITCFFTAFILGFMIDCWNKVFINVTIDFIIIKLMVFLIGILIVAFGLAIYLSTHLPENTIDYVMVEIRNKYNMKTVTAKMVVDGICMIGALFCGGDIGIGTLMLAFGLAPLTGIFENKLKRYLV